MTSIKNVTNLCVANTVARHYIVDRCSVFPFDNEFPEGFREIRCHCVAYSPIESGYNNVVHTSHVLRPNSPSKNVEECILSRGDGGQLVEYR